MNHYQYTFWLVCACFLANLTVFPITSFGQTLPASKQLRLLQPNGKERLQSGSQYTIKWTGIDSARPVRLEYSIDNGRSWKLITDKALGGEYLWKPIPNEPSDSCLILATGLAADSTESVNRSLVQFQVPRSQSQYNSNYWGGESASFSSDGTKILVTSFSQQIGSSTSYLGWRQTNFEVRDGKTGAILYTLPPYIIDSINYTRNSYWGWYGWGGGWGNGWGGSGQGRWSPDGRLLLSQISDTAFGVFDAQTGTLVRSITVPTQGNATRCVAMQWAAQGQEILATVQHRFFYPATNTGYLDTMKTMMMRFSVASGALANTPFRIGFFVFNSTGCNYGGWGYGGGGGNISNDGERRLTFTNDSTYCNPGSQVIRSTRDNSILVTLPTLSGGVYYWSNWGGGYGGNGSTWSPNDSLLAIYDYQTNNGGTGVNIISALNGQPIQRIALSRYNYGWYNNTQWSPDSRRILFGDYMEQQWILGGFGQRGVAPTSYIADVYTGVVQPALRNRITNGDYWGYGWGGYGWGGYGNGTGSGSASNSTFAWSPDGRFVTGFLWQLRSNSIRQDNFLNTVGIWDSQTGCLLQTFRLPFPDGTADEPRRSFFNTTPQWSADGKRLLLFSPLKYAQRRYASSSFANGQFQIDSGFGSITYDGTALIASVNIDQIPCQEDRSDSVFTILPRGALRVANVSFPTVQCGPASSSVTFPVSNTTSKTMVINIPTITGANASDFSLISVDGAPVDTITTLTMTTIKYEKRLEVRFTPSDFGDRVAQMTFTDTSGVELETITLYGRKDTLALATPSVRLNFSRVLQNSITSGSVSFRNLSTVPLYWDGQMLTQTSPLQQGGQMTGGQQFQSAAGRFRVDSLSPAMVSPGDSGRFYVTFLRTDKEGIFGDSATVLRCGTGLHQLIVTAEVIPNFPRMEVDSLLSFGRLICETSSVATLRVRNTGGKPLQIFNVGVLSDVFKTTFTRGMVLIVQPFDTLFLPLTFIPSSGGLTESVVVLNSDDLRNTQRSIVLRGQKTVFQYSWQPPALDFGNVSFGASRARTVTFVNHGTEPYRWTLPRALTDDFILERVEPNPVPAGTSATATVRFLGRREAMPVAARLNIPMNDPCSTQTRFDLTARVLDPQPRIVIPDTVRLASLSCASQTQSTITISNDGDADLRINAFAVEGENKFDFPKDSIRLGALTLKPQAITQLDFLFQALDTGTRTATLVLKTNDTASARAGEIRVVLIGRKDSVGFLLTRPPRRLTTVEEYTPLFDTLTIRNTGTVPLTWTNSVTPQAPLPFRIDTTFSIERIESVITPPQGSSSMVVRFSGGVAGFAAERLVPLQGASTLAPACSRPLALTVVGEVRKEPRLAQVADVSSRLLCENTTTLTIRLASIGTDDVVVSSIDVLDNPNGIVTIFSPQNRMMTLSARTGRDSIVITARTAQTGLFTARVRIRSNAANMPEAIVAITVRKDSSGLQAIPSAVDFGGFTANTPASRTVSIVNTGTIAQGFRLPLRAGVFVVDSLGMNPLPGNSQTQARVSFAGGMGGVERDTLRVADSCGRVLLLPLQARVVAGVVTLPDTVRLASNDEAELPIMLTNRKGVERGMEAVVRVKIGNATLVEVLSPLASGVERKQDSVWLTYRTLIPSEDSKAALLRLRLRGLLGNATTTTVRVDSAVVGGVALAASVPTHYRVLGLNYAGGGVRLLYTPRVQVIAVAPNPSTADVSVQLRVKEATGVVVQVVDMLGHRRLLFEGEVPQGEQALRLNTADLASGVYALELRTASQTITTIITIFH
ncbi:MAG: choice-of-anchor D domain-containing protein [Ignavibacteria bacterium]|nr:choice-of-anchor D domain-containing protein [Ignavibacteria bacterium]